MYFWVFFCVSGGKAVAGLEEPQIQARKENARGAISLHQDERVTLVTKSALRVKKKTRVHSPGTTAGNVVTGLPAASRVESWQMTFEDKKKFWGARRVATAAAADEETTTSKPRQNSDWEAVNMWSVGYEFYDEILNYDARCVCDLAVGDGSMAFCAIRKETPFFGVCVNEFHKEAVEHRLQQLMFKEMAGNQQSKLYDAGLARIVAGKRSVKDYLGGTSTTNTCTDTDEPPATKKSRAELKRQLADLQKQVEGAECSDGGSGGKGSDEEGKESDA